MSKWIFFVGKPYPQAYKLEVFQSSDYKIGVFVDKNLKLSHRENYDKVIEVDFLSEETLSNTVPQNIQVDGLVSTYENYVVAKSRLAQMFDVPSPSIESATKSTDKYLMRLAFEQEDPTINPRFELVSSKAVLIESARKLNYPLILKPTNLVKSLLVIRCNDEAELLKDYEYASEKINDLYTRQRIYGRQPQFILEECVIGKTCSIAAFVDSNGQPHFCEGIVSLTNAQDIGIDDNYIYRRLLPAEFNETLRAKMFETAHKGIKALQMTSTPAHVEIIYNDNEVKLIEIGARIGGYRPRMYSISYGIDLIAQELRLALDEKPDLSGNFKVHCAVFELFPETEGRFQGMEGLVDQPSFRYFSVKAKPGQLVGPSKAGYRAAAIVIADDQDEKIFSRLCEQVDSLRVRVKA